MKIASWNINSVRFRIDIVERFLKEMAPDILCLQETKAENAMFPLAALKGFGYPHIVINGQTVDREVPMKPGAGGIRFSCELPPLDTKSLPDTAKPGSPLISITRSASAMKRSLPRPQTHPCDPAYSSPKRCASTDGINVTVRKVTLTTRSASATKR